jgi:hypothetical protein
MSSDPRAAGDQPSILLIAHSRLLIAYCSFFAALSCGHGGHDVVN